MLGLDPGDAKILRNGESRSGKEAVGEKKSSDRGQAVPRINTMRDLGDAASAMASVLRLQLQT